MCRSNVKKIKADSLAKKLLNKDSRHFWKEIKKFKGNDSNTLAFTIDNVSGEKEICDLWKDHYKNVLNFSKDVRLKNIITDRLQHCTSSYNKFLPSEVNTAIKLLKNGKACGRDGLQSEHLKYS